MALFSNNFIKESHPDYVIQGADPYTRSAPNCYFIFTLKFIGQWEDMHL